MLGIIVLAWTETGLVMTRFDFSFLVTHLIALVTLLVDHIKRTFLFPVHAGVGTSVLGLGFVDGGEEVVLLL